MNLFLELRELRVRMREDMGEEDASRILNFKRQLPVDIFPFSAINR